MQTEYEDTDRLCNVRALMTYVVIVGTCVFVAFALASIGTSVIAALVGLIVLWPAAYVRSRRIKRKDPSWYPTLSDREGLRANVRTHVRQI